MGTPRLTPWEPRAALGAAWLRVTSVLMLLVMPAGIGMALLAEPAVLLLLGERWTGAIPAVRLWACDGVLTVFLSTAYYVHMAMGRPQVMTAVLTLHAVTAIPLMIALVPTDGAAGAALAILAATVLCLPVNFYLLLRVVELGVRDVVRMLWRPCVATATMAIAVTQLRATIVHDATLPGLLADAATGVLAGGSAYLCVMALLRLVHPDDAGADAYLLARWHEWRLRGAARKADSRDQA